MSLTKLIKNKNNLFGFEDFFISELVKLIPNESELTGANREPLNTNYNLRVSKKYINLSSYGFVGNCFDILARLELIRYTYNYKISELLSEQSIFEKMSKQILNNIEHYEILELKRCDGDVNKIESVRRNFSKEYVDKFKNIMLNIHVDLEEYTDVSDSELTIEKVQSILPSIYVLAKLEQIYRQGENPNFKGIVDLYDKKFYFVDLKDIEEDLLYLYGIFRARFINNGLVQKNSKIVFNPTFGISSALVGGADGDIIVDKTLFDFKCIKSDKYIEDYWLQLMGYYVLNSVGYKNNIDKLAIYRARHGEFEYVHNLPMLPSELLSEMEFQLEILLEHNENHY